MAYMASGVSILWRIVRDRGRRLTGTRVQELVVRAVDGHAMAYGYLTKVLQQWRVPVVMLLGNVTSGGCGMRIWRSLRRGETGCLSGRFSDISY